MHELYGTARQFLALFTPALQTLAAREWVRAYTGTAPSLEVVAAGYGEPVAIVWLCIQLENINQFAGAKEKMTVKRQKELAALILAEYPLLKVSEMLLFFHRLKCGRYGRFYGSVDALFISSALLVFADERKKELLRIKSEEQRRRQVSTASSTGVTYEEYLKLKQQKEHEKKSR